MSLRVSSLFVEIDEMLLKELQERVYRKDSRMSSETSGISQGAVMSM